MVSLKALDRDRGIGRTRILVRVLVSADFDVLALAPSPLAPPLQRSPDASIDRLSAFAV